MWFNSKIRAEPYLTLYKDQTGAIAWDPSIAEGSLRGDRPPLP